MTNRMQISMKEKRFNTTKQHEMNSTRTGFTLIELTAVVLIIGIIATAVSLTMAHSVSKRNFENVIGQFIWHDQITRRLCRNHNRTATLFFDIYDQQLRRVVIDKNSKYKTNTKTDDYLFDDIADADQNDSLYLDSEPQPDRVDSFYYTSDSFDKNRQEVLIQLPSSVRLDEVQFIAKDTQPTDTDLNFSTQGRSQTYALRFIGPDEQVQWIVILGLTGQVVKINDDIDIQAISAMLSRRNSR